MRHDSGWALEMALPQPMFDSNHWYEMLHAINKTNILELLLDATPNTKRQVLSTSLYRSSRMEEKPILRGTGLEL